MAASTAWLGPHIDNRLYPDRNPLQIRLHEVEGVKVIARQECKASYHAKKRARANSDHFSLRLARIDGRYYAARYAAAREQVAALRNLLGLQQVQSMLFAVAAE